MTIDLLKERIPDYAKDLRLNIGRLLTSDGAPGLSDIQIYGVALASAYASKNAEVIDAFKAISAPFFDESYHHGILSAVSIMAMNNIYYRSTGMVSEPSLTHLQTGLRMQVLANPGIPKVDFEAYSLAVSVVNGCHYCVNSHARKLFESGISPEGIQSILKISAVVYGVSQVLSIR